MAHKPPPAGWPQIIPGLFYRDPGAAMDWLCAAFDFEERLRAEGEPGHVIHGELMYGPGMVMISPVTKPATPGDRGGEDFRRRHASPLDVDGRVTQSICMYVDDIEAHCARARAHGARIVSEVTLHDYGDGYWADRSYGALDCEGHQWWFSERVRS